MNENKADHVKEIEKHLSEAYGVINRLAQSKGPGEAYALLQRIRDSMEDRLIDLRITMYMVNMQKAAMAQQIISGNSEDIVEAIKRKST